MILHVPHASRELTAEARASILLSDDELAEELDNLTDAHTAEIAARVPGVWEFRNRWSRLVVDPERFPDEREEMLAVGMGAVYTHGFAGRRLRSSDPDRDRKFIDEHFRPYARGVADLVGERLAATGRAVVVDVHSYPAVALPYELHGDGPRPPICVGTDDFHTPAALLTAANTTFPEMSLNSPFAGCYVPLEYYGREKAVEAVMIEIRRDCDPRVVSEQLTAFVAAIS
ncbi:N-formylglutamate amidohydrolase [Paractinoplanes atraurantiacus]|uniref:N-formylglutamate amidohydrolase n=1 Tax=Paractinoplanes atraurantiacus TaxID=1036182 RepID=UPI001FECCFBC|nr:N-formylglutamate amidohydrolase [Actinoplanes atraurantiacus]